MSPTTLRRARSGLYVPHAGGGGGGGGAAFVSTTNGTGSSTVTKPSGLAVGDHLLVVCADQYADITMTGFLDLGQYLFSTSANYEHVFYRQIDGTESSTFTVSGSGLTNYVAVAYRGGYGPPALVNGTPYDHITSFDSTYHAPVDGMVLHVLSACETSTGTLTPPASGVTSRGAMTSAFWSINICEEHASAGDSNTRTASPAVSSYANALTFMIPDAAPLPAALGRLVNNNGNSANASITIPSYAAVGDMFIAQFEVTANTMYAGPAGFTTLDTGNISGGNYVCGYWWGYKIIESGDIGATISCVSGSQVWGAAGMLIRNPGTLLPAGTGRNGSGATPVIPARAAPLLPVMAITGLMYSNDGQGGYVAINNAVKGLIWREARAGGSNYGGNEMAIQAVTTGGTSVAPVLTGQSTATWFVNTVLMAVGSFSNSYSDHVKATDPLVYWKLDEASGTAMADSSGHSRTGALVGSGATVGATSLLPDGSGKALTLPGSGSTGVDIAFASWMEVPVFSHEIIFKPTSLGGGQVLACRDDLSGSASTRHSVLYLHDNALAGAVHTNTNEVDFTPGVLVNGQTYHAVMTYDGTTVRAYLNGVLCPTTITPSGALNLLSGQGISVGHTNGFGGIWGFNGTVDEYAYYPNVLSLAQVRARYHAAMMAGLVSPTPIDLAVFTDDPIAAYTLNETSGTVATDKTGAGRHGLYAGTYTLNQSSIMPTDTRKSIRLGFSSGGIAQFPTHFSQNGMAKGFALECWVNFVTNASTFYGIATKWENGSASDDGLIWRNTSGNLAIDWYIGGTRYSAASSLNPTPGVLYHIVGEYDGRALNLYVNGSLIASTACSGTAQISSGCHINFGSFTNTSWWMDALVENAAVYDHPLGAARVAAHYAAG